MLDNWKDDCHTSFCPGDPNVNGTGFVESPMTEITGLDSLEILTAVYAALGKKERINRMFFNGDWKRRIIALESKMETIELEKRCLKGRHEWEMVTSSYNEYKPFVRCKHCYFTADSKTDTK